MGIYSQCAEWRGWDGGCQWIENSRVLGFLVNLLNWILAPGNPGASATKGGGLSLNWLSRVLAKTEPNRPKTMPKDEA